MEKQQNTLFQPEKKGYSSKKCLVISLSVFFTLLAVVGIGLGSYIAVKYNDSMKVKHVRYREVDENGNADQVDAYVSPRERRITQELEVEHRPGLHGNSSTLVSDFKSGFRAFRTKDEGSQCFVVKIEMTFDEEAEEVENKSPTKRRPNVVMPEVIHSRVLRMTAGDVIADHCRDVKTFWMVPAADGEELEDDDEERPTTVSPATRHSRAICRRRICYWYLSKTWLYYRCVNYYYTC